MGLFGKKKKGSYDDELDNEYTESYDGEDGGVILTDDGLDDEEDDYSQKGSNLGKIGVIIGAIIVIGLLYVGVSSIWGPRTGQCKETIAELQGGINELNPDRFINVLEPKTKRIIQIIFVTLESTTDIDMSNAFADALNSICKGMLPSDTGEPVTDLLKKIKIVPINYGLPGFTRSVKCKVQFDGVTYKYIRIKLKKYEGETYIRGITLLDK